MAPGGLPAAVGPDHRPSSPSAASPVLTTSAGQVNTSGGSGGGSITTPAGTVWGWSDDNYGELGDNNGGQGVRYGTATPVEAIGLTGIVAVATNGEVVYGGDSTNGDHSLALRSDGTVWAMGSNDFGELGAPSSDSCVVYGYPSIPCSLTPIQVSNLSGVKAIAAGGRFSLALKTDGTVWSWGENTYGQLGATSSSSCVWVGHTFPCSLVPIQVTGLSNVVAIAAGNDHALALKGDGTVWAWGFGALGQIGDGSTYDKTTEPMQVTGLSGVTAVAGGIDHSLALKSDGTVWAWGWNALGQVGALNGVTCSNTDPCVVTPVQISGVIGVTAISTRGDHNLALKGDGTVWAWGENDLDQLGARSSDTCTANGYSYTFACSRTPVQSGISGTVTAIIGGGTASFALKSDGSVWAWGDDAYLELGVTSTNSTCTDQGYKYYCSMKPLQNTNLGSISALSGGAYQELALNAMPTQAAPTNSQYNDAPYQATTGGSVDTYTGVFSYTYNHTDLDIAGLGPSPTFVRSYNSNDTRVTALGVGWTHNYAVHLASPGDGTGDLILVEPNGRSDRYKYSGGTFTAPVAVHTTLTETVDGTYVATLKDQTTWTFNGGGALIAIGDRYGNRSVLSYNASGQLVSVGDPATRGNLSFGYNASGQLTSVTDWANRVVQFGYDGSGRLQTYTDRDGKTTTYGYDASNRLTTITDADNHTQITNTYDSSGRVQTQQDALGNQTTYSYGTGTTTVTYPATSYQPGFQPTVTDTYDTSGRLTQRVSKPSSSEAYTETFGYDANFDLTSHTDARGNTTAYCYDVDYSGAAISGSAGNLTRVIAPPPSSGANVPVTLFQHDSKNNLLETVPPKGVASGTSASCSTNFSGSINTMYATDNTYDANGVDLLSTTRRYTDPDSGQQTAITKYEYNDPNNPGRVTRVIPPRGNTTSTPDYSYATTMTYYGSGSQAGLLQSTTDADGNQTTYTYDAVGRKLTMVDPDGNAAGGSPSAHIWTWSYDSEDRTLTVSAPAPTTGGAALTTQYQYDAVGDRTVVIDANGQVMKNAYDARNALSEVDQSPSAWTDPNATPSPKIATTYTYDNLGNLTRVTRDQGDSVNERATDYLYDGAGHLRQEIEYPSWPATTPTLTRTYAYDGDGNQISLIDPLNQTTSFVYDTLNRLTGVSYGDGQTPNVTYAYDADSNRTSMSDGTGTTSYALDELDRLTAVTSPGNVTVGYRYDLDGNRTKVIYPDGTAVTSAYDKAGRLASLADWASRTTSYGYFPDGNLETVTNVDGSTATYTDDNAQRLTQVSNQQGTNIIDQHSYTLDNVGNRTQRQETLATVGGGQPVTTTTAYSYDALYRLTGDGTNSYAYDPVGNRTTLTVGGNPTTYAYDRADRITAAGAIAYTVNANGNVTTRGADTFAYDQANRLKSATVAGTTTTYLYDGDGNRASETVGGATTSYAYDRAGGLPLVLSDGAHKYVYGAQGLACSGDASGNVTVYHTDGLGSVRALTDGSGNLLQTYQTDAFGNVTASQGTVSQPFEYAGQQVDGNGLVYLRARYYEPATGRFLSRDVLRGDGSDPQSLNRYTYVHNNPLTRLDPSGKCSEGSEYAANNCEDNPPGTENPDQDSPDLSPSMGLGGGGGTIGPDASPGSYTRRMYRDIPSDASYSALRQNPKCVYCGENSPTEVDHVTSQKEDWQAGGYNDDRATRSARVNDPSNLVGACKLCNSSKGAKKLGQGPGQWWPPHWPDGSWWPFGGSPKKVDS